MTIVNYQHLTNNWNWHEYHGKQFLQSELLKQGGFTHGFFTKLWGGKPPEDLISCLNSKASVHYLKQIHSNYVVEALSNGDISSFFK